MALPKNVMTPDEYLDFERHSDTKHEYHDGEIFAMTGASEEHNLITINTGASLHSQLRKRPCKLYTNDMRVKTRSKSIYVYPDISIVCGEAKLEDKEFDTLLNPTVIIEVLSPSTEGYDRGKKFQDYRTLNSLQEYILISQDSAQIEHYARRDDAWVLTDARGLDALLSLPSIDCTLALSDVYEKVEFEEEA